MTKTIWFRRNSSTPSSGQALSLWSLSRPQKRKMEQINSSTTERIFAAAGLIGGAAVASVVAWFNPVTAGFFPQCPLYQMTGLACPGCGLTRGFHALFHGDVLTALDYNVLVPIWVLIFGYAFVSLSLLAARGREL